ncbi:MAG: hypothetical protein DWB56_16520 [Candidatus Jettenia sp.]|uniref:hypothetical protein n=1 Tax=Candidatus Jettenia sp. AMX1 TaxID=2293637 RepID=UPI0013FABE91|nr:hypothetical protein [Candidatus Jettenia sp. AMX1]MBC6930523.1 hypothetical protein [Candidatus Jettenia sp.]NUN24359.1 hypothetical protein [Candidatus Jettenia caeni]KAA0246527.1 MAG: hypothetical protein EDM77_16740 [Candidatus Jettenia sp. AMX1]MCE7882139.1 hypothetical protein [Candidatus Jettenia sp. AMX1]MCQ3928656.1 hypothetical protein [Candidatus Jettenia sp.]
MKICHIGIISACLLVIAMTSTVVAQEEQRKTDSDYSALIRESLPVWDESVLNAPKQKLWTERASIQLLTEAVRDKVPEKAEKESFQDKERKLQIEKDRGYVRYINANRGYKHGVSPTKAVAKDQAEKMIVEAVKTIGVPEDELKGPGVSTVLSQGGSVQEKTRDEAFAREQLVYIERNVNNLPVFASEIKGAISNSGEISRLLVKWPDFFLADVQKLRPQDQVINDIVTQIQDAMQGRPVLSVNMKLAYTPLRTEGRIKFVPGIVVAVTPEEGNGFMFTVPVAN